MSSKVSGSWLFFLFNLPGTRASERVKVWRRLKKFGAIQLKVSTYVLPDEPVHYERFQWLAKEIVDAGGEATLARVKDIEGMPHAAIVAMFNKFHRVEGFGVEQIFKGLAKQGLTDHEILSKGFECFEALYAQFKRS
jgi:hypothetical protein